MIRNKFRGPKTGKILVSALILFIFTMLKINSGFAYEREIILGEAYETKKDKERIEKRFGADFSIGYGFSYPQFLTGLYGLDSKYETYLNDLNMKYSESYTTLRLTLSYLINSKLGVYAGTPFGLVHTKAKFTGGRQSASRSNQFGIGDIYAGTYYQILSETEKRPDIVFNFDANSNITKYSSLGDGVWDYTPAIQVRKTIFKPLYIYGSGDYTFRQKEKNVEPGNVIGYGGGLGVITSQNAIEAGLKAARIEKTKIDGAAWFDKTNDLVFNFGIKSLNSGGSVNLTIGNLDSGFDVKTNNFGIEISIPIM